MILLLMCAAIGLTQAQAQLSFGVKAGANFSTISKIDFSSIGPDGKVLSSLFENNGSNPIGHSFFSLSHLQPCITRGQPGTNQSTDFSQRLSRFTNPGI